MEIDKEEVGKRLAIEYYNYINPTGKELDLEEEEVDKRLAIEYFNLISPREEGKVRIVYNSFLKTYLAIR